MIGRDFDQKKKENIIRFILHIQASSTHLNVDGLPHCVPIDINIDIFLFLFFISPWSLVYLCAIIPFPYLPPDSCTRGWGSLKKITINLDDAMMHWWKDNRGDYEVDSTMMRWLSGLVGLRKQIMLYIHLKLSPQMPHLPLFCKKYFWVLFHISDITSHMYMHMYF